MKQSYLNTILVPHLIYKMSFRNKYYKLLLIPVLMACMLVPYVYYRQQAHYHYRISPVTFLAHAFTGEWFPDVTLVGEARVSSGPVAPRDSAKHSTKLKKMLERLTKNRPVQKIILFNDTGSAKPISKTDKSNCVSTEGVAIIVPYRDREEHLATLTTELVPFVQNQKISFHLFIMEQNAGAGFNRAKLFNVGFNESLSMDNFSCFIFHDVDLVPLSSDNYYCCERNPKHMAVAIDKFKYRLPYRAYSGGVLAMTKESFLKVNGFSNVYFGWGGEDDDMTGRIASAGYSLARPSLMVGQYRMLEHKQEHPSEKRHALLRSAKSRFSADGVTSVNYTVLSKRTEGLKTHIKVDIRRI